MTGFIDRILNIAISKKLTVFILGTIFLFYDKIDAMDWLNLSMLYLGVQGSIDLFKEYINRK